MMLEPIKINVSDVGDLESVVVCNIEPIEIFARAVRYMAEREDAHNDDIYHMADSIERLAETARKAIGGFVSSTCKAKRKEAIGTLIHHDLEAEASLLSALMVNPGPREDIVDLLMPHDFYNSRHQLIYEHLMMMPGKPDLASLVESLCEHDDLHRAGGAAWVGHIFGKPPAKNINQAALAIKELSIQRNVAMRKEADNET